ncbi:MAG: hypothetical protein QM627_09250 [Luteolibacter sp.]
MSNATKDSQNNSGESRRRRSRGGKNRRNQNQERRSGQGNGQNQGRRQEEFRPNKGASRPARSYAPTKLTLWQRFLKLFGLYNEPKRPERPPQPPKKNPQQQQEGRSPKSNVRNARSAEGTEPQAGEKRQRSEKSERRSRGGDRDSVESARVYVGNLSYEVTEQDLQELFKGIGPVRNTEIVYNRSTHRSKGYGFVEMLNVDEAKRSVEVLHDQFFMGRKLIVSGAKSKGQDEREDREERTERKPRPVVVAPIPEETVVPLSEATPEVVVEAAVENVAAVGAPEVIIEAVEHQVVEAVEAAEEAPTQETPAIEEQKEKPAEG